jgi:hypothetical protein
LLSLLVRVHGEAMTPACAPGSAPDPQDHAGETLTSAVACRSCARQVFSAGTSGASTCS